MFEDLGKLITVIQSNYIRICNIWSENVEKIHYANSTVTSRVKAQNSIKFKLENYYTNHEGVQSD